MKNRRPSLKDIAKKLNVSVTTVSFVLNGKGKEKKISDEVIKKVLDYIEEINYRPNLVAQSLRTGRTKILVFMVEDISNYFYSKIGRIIEDLANEEGYKVLFCSNENNDERSKELIDLFYERQVDGFIISPSPGIKNELEFLVKANVPLILFDRYFPDLDTNFVVIDNIKATYDATRHLIEKNFKNIGFITIDVQQTQMRDRLTGYKRAVEEYNLENYVLQIPYKERGSSQGKNRFYQFLKKNKDLDAVFFSTNYLTQIGLEVLKENFPKELHDLGIITFDDNDLFKIHTPSISAVSQPLQGMGESLMKIMLKMLKDEVTQKEVFQIVLETNLVERESSGVKSSSLI